MTAKTKSNWMHFIIKNNVYKDIILCDYYLPFKSNYSEFLKYLNWYQIYFFLSIDKYIQQLVFLLNLSSCQWYSLNSVFWLERNSSSRHVPL
jgi:hypothetical protein